MATIEGTVTDGNSGIEDALVTISNSATDTVEYRGRTDANGDYGFTVDPDTYDVRAERIGYEASEKINQNVGTNETKTVDLTLPALQPKVVGRRSDVAIGVVGESTASSGMPIGVQASVDSPEGYGLYTPDNVLIEGDIESLTGHRLFVDKTTKLALGTSGSDLNNNTAGGNVIAGYTGNGTQNDAIGVTISGGGSDGSIDLGDGIGERDHINEVVDDYGTIGGGQNNRAGVGAGSVGGEGSWATVGGGLGNTASGQGATVGGGLGNTASGRRATISGGNVNTASGIEATVGGGEDNTANGGNATVGGGFNNEAYGDDSTIAGGFNNRTGESETPKGRFATVAGGEDNVAREDYSFAAGREAYARAQGSFVWGDSSDNSVESLTEDEVVFQANGGVVMWTNTVNTVGAQLPDGSGSWTSASARAVKSDIDPVDPDEVLDGVEDLELSTWEYDSQHGVTHMGPMAGEFHDTFDLGDDDERISSVDADGVALAAIQGLAERLDEKDDRIDDLESENRTLREDVDDLEAENDALRERLAAVEEHLDTDAASEQPSPADH